MSNNNFKKPMWLERPRRSAILECSCGGRYIKTRKEQSKCVQCINYPPQSGR